MPSPAVAEAAPAAAEAVNVSVVPVESGHEESFFAWFPSLFNEGSGKVVPPISLIRSPQIKTLVSVW